MADNDWLIMPRYFSKRFIIFGAIVLIGATIMLIFFNNTPEEEFTIIGPKKLDTATAEPYRAINPVTVDSLSSTQADSL